MEGWWDHFALLMQYLNILADAGMIGFFFRPFLLEKKKAIWIQCH